MCGISGLVMPGAPETKVDEMVRRMNLLQAHRGPDHDGVFLGGTVCLGHRRLSIIDLSAAGNQPFSSADGRYRIVYNGELYNFRELKLELQRAPQGSGSQPFFFQTSTDTEVVLAAYIRWGAGCLRRFNGMFAFAVYDTHEHKLFLARDRFGVKPLYYYYGNEGIAFASELRAILRSGIRNFALNEQVVAEYLTYQTVLAPQTIVKGIRMLDAGHYAEFAEGKANITRYYDLNDAGGTQADGSYADVCARVKELLALSVQRRLVSDVPFGAFLSGGIDSSSVVALMATVSAQKVRTFNITFEEPEFSESQYARIVAKKFNTVHHEIVLRPADFLRMLPEALEAMDHPSGDGPNTYVVSKATRQAGITMALSGIGGDELFAGYPVFRRMTSLSNRAWLNAVPRTLRAAIGASVRATRRSVAGEKVAETLALSKLNPRSAYPLTRAVFTKKELSQLTGGNGCARVEALAASFPLREQGLLSFVSRLEMETYLQNVLLRDTDQMGMAVALEIREPFLDHQLVDYVLSLTDAMKYPSSPKKLLVDAMGDLLPHEVVNRPKMGFTFPWAHWMQNELKAFCESNIVGLSRRPFMNEAGVIALWNRFRRNDPRVPWSRIWHLVVLNAWIATNIDRD